MPRCILKAGSHECQKLRPLHLGRCTGEHTDHSPKATHLNVCMLSSVWARSCFWIGVSTPHQIFPHPLFLLTLFFIIITGVDTEMCCPKGKCGCQYFILLTLKRTNFMETGVLDFFNKKLILDYYFCLMSGPVFLFQIFIVTPSPSQGISNCIINNKLINNKFRFSI